MKFAFIVNNYPPRVGGVELHVHALATELLALGHEVTVITLSEAPSATYELGAEIIRLQERLRVGDVLGFPPLGTKRKISRILRSRDIDAVSIHTRFFPMSYLGLRSAQNARIPVVHTEHGSDHVASDSLLIRICSRIVDLTIGRIVLQRANQVLGVSEAVVEFVKRLAGVKASVFYNAITETQSIPLVSQDCTKYVFVGRIVPGKGWDTFLQMIANLHREDTSITAHIIGDGPDIEAAALLIEELNLSGVAILHGRQSQQQVREHLRGATLVNPTTLAEGFQTTLIEAVAEGGRVLTFPVPGSTKLRETGAPVYITSDRTLENLELVAKEINRQTWVPASRAMLAPWFWPRRAQEFVAICLAAVEKASARKR